MAKKILFLNPPGNDIYIRDYYCSKVSKAYYLPQPVDLLMQIGYFADKGYEVFLIDAIVDKTPFQQVIEQIKNMRPDLIITQCGAVSFEEDNIFFKKVKEVLPCLPILWRHFFRKPGLLFRKI